MAQPKILAFGGSLRAGSFNQKAATLAAEGARSAGAEVTLIALRDFPMPIFDEDLEAAEGMPENAGKCPQAQSVVPITRRPTHRLTRV